MENVIRRFARKMPDGTWGDIKITIQFDNVPDEELNAMGWWRIKDVAPPDSDVRHNVSFVYAYDEIDNRVYQNYTVTLKNEPELSQAYQYKWLEIRGTRQMMLAETDYTQLPDAPISAEDKAAWATYRQALRDITNQQDPFAITWPTSPLGTTGVSIGVHRV